MMIELLRGAPIIIPVEAIPKANININYKTKNIPAHRLKNQSARKAKERYDHAMQVRDLMVLTLQSEKNKRGLFHEVKKTDKIWTSYIYYFRLQKYTNEAMLIKDTDNCNKMLHDTLQDAGYMPNDCQISFHMTAKQVVKENPRIEIVSFAVADTWSHFMEWSAYAANLTARRIYEHQLSLP